MRLLLSNDDGVLAPGLQALARALHEEHELVVCAPAGECSATSNGLTLRDPLRLEMHDLPEGRFHGLAGLPADAAKFGLGQLMADTPPDLVLSGINNGLNTGQNVFYSGTVAAATEGVFAGIPAIAFSRDREEQPDFSGAIEVVREVLAMWQRRPLPADILLNVNIPALPRARMKGYRFSRMGVARFKESFHGYRAPDGRQWYWVEGRKDYHDAEAEHDDWQVHNGWVSLSPLRMDVTAAEWRDFAANWEMS